MAVGVDGKRQLNSLKAEEQGSRRVVVVHQKLLMKGGRGLRVGLVASFAKGQAEDMEGIFGWQLGTDFVEDILGCLPQVDGERACRLSPFQFESRHGQ